MSVCYTGINNISYTQVTKNLMTGDAEIIRQVIDGNVNAFESLVKKYRNFVTGIVYNHVNYSDVDEVSQEAFIRIYKSLSNFKGKGGFKQWLSSITVRTCYDYWRKAYRSKELPMSTLTEKHEVWMETVMTEQYEVSINEKGMQDEAKELLDWALGKLSAENRMVLELVYLQGLSIKEAACLLGWSAANVKIRSFRSRKKLKKILTEVKRAGGKNGTN